jgi:hypothetical protein
MHSVCLTHPLASPDVHVVGAAIVSGIFVEGIDMANRRLPAALAA